MSKAGDAVERVTSTQEYKQLIRCNKSRFEKTDTNCFLMSRGMEPYIQQGRLFVRQFPEGMAMYVDEGSYYELYYFWNSRAPMADLRRDKPVSLVEVDEGGKRGAYLAGMERKLFTAGFCVLKDTCQVEMNPCDPAHRLKESLALDQARMADEGLRFHYDDGSNLPRAVELWREYLDLADVPLDHTSLKPEDKLLCVMSKDDRLAAVHWWRHTGKFSEGRHTVTHPDYYRRGLASAMLRAWCLDAKERGISKAATWIRTTNYKSLALYRKVGFVPNGRVSRQYILKEPLNKSSYGV